MHDRFNASMKSNWEMKRESYLHLHFLRPRWQHCPYRLEGGMNSRVNNHHENLLVKSSYLIDCITMLEISSVSLFCMPLWKGLRCAHKTYISDIGISMWLIMMDCGCIHGAVTVKSTERWITTAKIRTL